MQLIVDLQDHEGKSHGDRKCTLGNEATVEELEEAVENAFHIKRVDQELFYKDDKLRFGTLVAAGIKDKDTIIVRHCFSSQWPVYVLMVQDFREAKDNRTKREHAIRANEKSKTLEQTGLFDAYSSYALEWIYFCREYATFLDNVPTSIKEAAKSFFIRKFSDKLIDVEFKNKPSGTRSGAICIVSFDEIQRVFYVKTNHNASSISITQHGLLSMIELFIYKFLEILSVGAVVEFIPNVVASDRIVYICGEEISGFKTIAMLEKDWVDFEPKLIRTQEAFAKGIVQLSLLTQILGLDDLNAENIGFNEHTASFHIVDFRTGFIDSSIGFEGINRPKTAMSLVAQLKMNLGRFLDLVKEQLKIAKECIAQWEISSKLDVALAKLDEGKEVFNRADLLFNKGTENLKEYITIVREKINQINNL